MTKSRFTPQYDRFLAHIRALRSSKGIVQADLANRLGVPQQYISRWETGETRMDIVQVWRYCTALGVSFTKLCRELEREFAHSKPGKRARRRSNSRSVRR